MKFRSFLVCLWALSMVACSKDDDPEKKDPDNPPATRLQVSFENVYFTAQKDASLVVVTTGKSWQASCNADWIELSALQGDTATGFLIGAKANRGFPREATVTISTSDESKDIRIEQAGVSRIEFEINGVSFTFLPVQADTSFYLDGATYLAARTVKLSSFFISQTEITNAQWKAVTGSLPYEGEDNQGELPLVANWNAVANDFIPAFRSLSGYPARLPTENEWEVAARGGLQSGNTSYAGSMYIDQVAWHYRNSDGKKHPVAQKQANELGLYDMSGNVSEWCSDWYAEWTDSNLPPTNVTNPTGPPSGTLRVIRGGDYLAERFEYDRNSCAVYARNALPPDIDTPDFQYDGYPHFTGFRLVIPKD